MSSRNNGSHSADGLVLVVLLVIIVFVGFAVSMAGDSGSGSILPHYVVGVPT